MKPAQTKETNKKPLQILVDKELHARFKAYCALHRITLADKITALMEEAMKGGK